MDELEFLPGIIGRIEQSGFGIIKDATGQEYPFTFAAIEQYRGETTKSLAEQGFSIGQQVLFARQGEKVIRVKPYIQSPLSSASANTTSTGP